MLKTIIRLVSIVCFFKSNGVRLNKKTLCKISPSKHQGLITFIMLRMTPCVSPITQII